MTISRSSLSIKVIGSRSYEKNDSFTYFNLLILSMWLQVINKVKVIHQGEGHTKVKVKYLHPFKFYIARTLCNRVVCIQLKCYLLILRSGTGIEFACTVANFSVHFRRQIDKLEIITTRKRSCGKVIFYTCLSVILFAEGFVS